MRQDKHDDGAPPLLQDRPKERGTGKPIAMPILSQRWDICVRVRWATFIRFLLLYGMPSNDEYNYPKRVDQAQNTHFLSVPVDNLASEQ